jgi:hypothetical protein
MPTPELAAEVRHLFDLRYSASSKSSIAAALVHWDVIRLRHLWSDIIRTGDTTRGAKLCVFVLHLVEHPSMYPSSTISNYVWALCAHMQLHLQADPRVNVIGWPFFMTSVTVLCYMPGEPRKRVPTSLLRAALAAVDRTDFVQVQTALLVLFLYFTFQRSELPCPKSYDGIDPLKHLLVKHMEPHDGGTRWAVGTTKADPRAERLSSDAGPGREWIVVGEVDDELFDMRVWLSQFYSLLPQGPRLPDSPFFVSRDKKRPLLYSQALPDFRTFLLNGGCDDPQSYGLHGIRSEAFVTCSGAVSEEAAVIQGGWSTVTTASRYDRLTLPVAKSIASKMVSFHLVSQGPDSEADPETTSPEALRSAGDSGIVAARRAAHTAGGGRPSGTARVHQPISLPAGWTRIWHPTSGRAGGYATFEGPHGATARSLKEAIRVSSSSDVAPRAAAPTSPQRGTQPVGPAATDILENLTVYDDRPSTRPPPSNRSRV